jgi:hypothetical protein
MTHWTLIVDDGGLISGSWRILSRARNDYHADFSRGHHGQQKDINKKKVQWQQEVLHKDIVIEIRCHHLPIV